MSSPRSEIAAPAAPEARSLAARLLGRLRHGLLLQELLDRLARRGLVIYPYLLFEAAMPRHPPEPDPGYRMRRLAASDVDAIRSIQVRERPREELLRLLAESECYGLFLGRRLVGYRWVRFDRVPVPGARGAALLPLAADEAYLFDMYTAPDCRGRGVAEKLRNAVLHALEPRRLSRYYGIVLCGNRSSRRFSSRFAACVEVRLYVHLRIGRLPGLDLRLWRAGAVATPIVRLVPAQSPAGARDRSREC